MIYRALRSLLFSLPPNAAHALGMVGLWPAEFVAPVRALTRAVYIYSNSRGAVTRMGLTFPNRVGVAGGFDKNATRARALAALGFGFVEVGTVTAIAQSENPRPNLFRLPQDRALINRLGFPNEGAKAVCDRIAAHGGGKAVGVPLAVSIGKSRAIDIEDVDAVLADYGTSFSYAHGVADFVVVNVSSPNTKNLRALQNADAARALLRHLMSKNISPKKPVLLKIAPDLSDEDLASLLAVVKDVELDGVIATNTTIARTGLVTPAAKVARFGAGGLSGAPLRRRAIDVVTKARAALGADKTIIGVGGIETPTHARAMIDAGADLVQVYTGFIYEGPGLPRRISRALAQDAHAADAARELTVN